MLGQRFLCKTNYSSSNDIDIVHLNSEIWSLILLLATIRMVSLCPVEGIFVVVAMLNPVSSFSVFQLSLLTHFRCWLGGVAVW